MQDSIDHLKLLPSHHNLSYTSASTQDATLDPTEIPPELLSGDEGEPRNDDIPDSKKSSFTGVVFNILNTTIGGSILALPYIIRQLGIIVGCSVLALGAFLILVCSALLQKTKNLSGHSNYVTIARYCFGKKGGTLLSLCLLISNLGSCIVFLSIFALVAQNSLSFFLPECSAKGGDLIAPLFCQRSVLIAIGALIVLPFTFPKSIGKLRIISFVKMASVIIFAAITIGYCIYSVSQGTYSSEVQWWPTLDKPIDMLACIAEVILAYIFTYNQFSIYKSMRRPSDTDFNKASRISLSTITVIFIMIGVSGYFIFGNQTNNILQSFTVRELGPTLFLLLNVSFMVFSITTYPPTFFCPRNVLYMAVLKGFSGNKVNPKSKESYYETIVKAETDSENSTREKTVYTGVVLGSNAIIAMLAIVAPNINDLFGLMGSIAANALVFLFPPAFYLMLSSKKAKGRITAKLLFALGVVVGVVGFVCNILKIFVEGD